MNTTANWIQQADAALKRAAKRAREVAERTDTAVHVLKGGKIVNLLQDRAAWVLREEAPPYGAKAK